MAVTNIPISATTTDFVGAIDAARKAVGNFDRDLNTKLTNSFRALDREQRVYEKGLGRLKKEMEKGTGGPTFMDSLGGAVGLAAGVFTLGAALSAVKTGLSITSDFQRLDSALKAVSTSTADYNHTQNLLRTTSDSLGISYEALADAYKGLKAASNGTVIQGAATEKIFLSVVHAGAALKLSNDEVKGSLLAIQQMMSKGTVQAEELRGQLGERLPGAFKLMADGLGVTEQKLGKMLQAGEVLATDALPKLAEQLEKTYGAQAQANVNSMAGGFTRLTDQTKLFVAEFSKTSGIDIFFTKLGNGLANYVQGLREAQRRGEGIFLLSGDRRKELAGQSQLRQQFSAGNPAQRGVMLAGLNVQADDYRNKIANPKAFGYNEAVVNANRRALAGVEEKITVLKREQLKLLVAERKESGNSAKLTIIKPRIDIDLLNKQKSALATQISNAKLNGEPVAALQAKYDALTKQIDKATDSTRKHSAAVDSGNSGLTTNERILRDLTRQLKEYGDSADGARSRRVALFQELVSQDKELANNKPVALGGKATPIKSNISFTDAFNGLTGNKATPKLPGLEAWQKSIQDGVKKTQEILADSKAGLRAAGGDMLAGIADGFTAGGNPLKNALKTILNVLSSYLIQMGIALLTAASFSAAAAAFPNPLTPILAKAGINQYLAGGVMLAGGAAIKGLAGYAKGGVFTNETVGRFGEYAGANLNPEIATPQRLMASVVRNELKDYAPRGGSQVVAFPDYIPVSILEGTTLKTMLRRAGITSDSFGTGK